jgi:hypothetical protein
MTLLNVGCRCATPVAALLMPATAVGATGGYGVRPVTSNKKNFFFVHTRY